MVDRVLECCACVRVMCMWCVWGSGGVHRVLVGKPEGRRPMGRHRRRWEDNIKRDLQK
jgi:hypothetical protein